MKTFLKLWVYVFPFPALIFFYFHWNQRFNDVRLTHFLIFLPIVYGYVVPGVATNIMKKWRFIGKFTMGNYYIHHGFKYAANMNLWFFLASTHADLSTLNTLQWITLCIATGVMQGFFIWIHDTLGLKHGHIILTNVLVKPGMSPEEQTFTYAPLCFFCIGFSYALSVWWFYFHLDANIYLSIWGCMLFMLAFTSIPFGLLERAARKVK